MESSPEVPPGSRRASRLGRAAGLAAAVLLTASTAAGCALVEGTSPQGPPRCPLSDELVPSCGALLGVTSPKPTSDSLATTEDTLGRRVDFVYRFHDVDDAVPTDEERELLDEGRLLHLTIDSRNFADPTRESVQWADVADGRYDETLAAQARGIASLDTPVFVTFDHEPDQPAEDLGSAGDFVAAWRHVHDLYTAEGATNAVWVWVVMGWEPTLHRAAALWPGRDYVDWMSWEAYNASGCRSGPVDASEYASFEESMLPAYRWLTSGEHDPLPTDLPIMISEAGTSPFPGDPERTAAWYAAIPATLAQYPQVKAVGLWDHGGTGAACDFRFGSDPAVTRALRTMASDPVLDTQTPATDG